MCRKMCLLALVWIGFGLVNPNVLLSQNSNSMGIWISPQEIAQLPASGEAWDNMLAAANESTSNPDVSNQNDPTNVGVLAKAFVYARTGDEIYRQEVIEACMAAIGTEQGGRTLALGRELMAYVIAADLVGLPSSDDTQFRTWLRDMLTEPLSGRTLVSTHEDRPNNWGTHAGASRAAVAVYLGDQQELDRCATVFKGYLGDRDSYAGFSFGDLDWQADPNNPVGINPAGAIKEGHNIDGVLPDEQRRSGGFSWPPPQENYVYEGLQGALAQAVILHRQGYDVWNWEDKALLRAFQWLHSEANYPAEGDDTWQPHLINFYYGSNFPAPVPSMPGKNVGWTDWTHGSGSGPGGGVTGIEGRVHNSASGDAVGSATVQLKMSGNIQYQTQSNSSGHYSFTDVQAGIYELAAAKNGFDDFSTNVNIPDGQTLFGQDIELNPLAGGGGDETLTFQSVHDGHAKLTDPKKKFGTKPIMKVKAGTFDSYMKFVVTNLNGEVQSAIVRLQVTSGGSDGSDMGGQIFLASNDFSNGKGPWVEKELSASTAPNTISGALSSVGEVGANQVVDFDVTSAINGNGTYSFCVSSTSNNAVKYHTKEGAAAPQLVIQTSGSGGGGGNNVPVATNDNASTASGTAVPIDVTANDMDSDGTIDVTTVALQSTPANGFTTVSGTTGVVTYTPNSGFGGTDTFTYTVKDNQGAVSNTATVAVAVAGNEAPIANDDAASTAAGQAVTIDVTANDTDSDGSINVTTVVIQTTPGGGTVAVDPNTGVISYTANNDFSGSDTFTYNVQDDQGALSNTATVTVAVAGNEAPVANNDAASTIAGQAVTIDVTANDADSDGNIDVTTVAIQATPDGGSVTVDGTTGAVTYIPDSDFSGTDLFSYTVEDNLGAISNTATVTVTVASAGGDQILTFRPIDDNQVKLTKPGANYGVKTTMKVDAGNFASYMKFEVAGLGGSTVQSAVIRLQVADGASDGSETGGQIFQASNDFSNGAGPWAEESLTASNAPNTISSVLSTLGPVAPNQVVEFDVTGTISGNGTFSFCINTTSGDRVRYYTKEGLTAPDLVIQTIHGGGSSNAPAVNKDLSLRTESLQEDLSNDQDDSLAALPETVKLHVNYPNPFNASTTIEYEQPAQSKVKLQIYNVRGQLIRTLVDGEQSAGYKRFLWKGRNDDRVDVSSGVYFLNLEIGVERFSRKIILQK